jgi:hypothetical protein
MKIVEIISSNIIMPFSTLRKKPSLIKTSRTSRTSGTTKGSSKKPKLPNIYANIPKLKSLKSSKNNSIVSTLPLIRRSSRFKDHFNKSESPYPYNIKRDKKRSTIRKAKNYEQIIKNSLEKKRQNKRLENKLQEALYESNDHITSIKNTDLFKNSRIAKIMSTNNNNNNNQITQESLDENIDNHINFLRNKQKQSPFNKLKKKIFKGKKKKNDNYDILIYNNKSRSYIPSHTNKGKDIKCKKKNKFVCAFTRGCKWEKQTKSCNIKKKKPKTPKSICKGKRKKNV